MLQIIKGLLTVVSLLMKWADNAKQQEIGKDKYVKEQLADLVVKIGMAKKIDMRSEQYSDADIAAILRDRFRKE